MESVAVNITRIKELTKLIPIYATIDYEGKESYKGFYAITDEEFDAMVEELVTLDPSNYLLHTTGWGYVPSDGSRLRRAHFIPVTGISRKTKSNNLLSQFIKTPLSRVLTPKLDGASIVIKYLDGKVSYALSRGNGTMGVDVTNIITQLPSVPATIDYTGELHVRGELLNIGAADNIRNQSSGLIMRVNYTLTEDEKDNFIFIPYRIMNNDSMGMDKVQELEFIKHLGFIPVNYIVVQNDLFQDYWDNNKESAFTFLMTYNDNPLPIDGLIIESIDQDELIAFKTDSAHEETEVTKIVWKLSGYGKYFPTVYYKPVYFDGCKNVKCSAGSFDYIESKGLGIGAKILVKRSGGVIPTLVRVLEKSQIIPIPEDSYLKGAHLFLKGHSVTEEKLIRSIFMRFVPHGFGADLYKRAKSATPDAFESVEQFKIYLNTEPVRDRDFISTTNQLEGLKSTIQGLKSYKVSMNRILSLASIMGLGPKLLKKLNKKFSTLQELIDYMQDPDYGNISKYSNTMVQDSVKKSLDNLITLNEFFKDHEILTVEDKIEEVVDTNLPKVILTQLTGSPLSKNELKAQFSDKVKFVGSVKEADIVVYHKPGSSKFKEAEKLGKATMTVEKFIKQFQE